MGQVWVHKEGSTAIVKLAKSITNAIGWQLLADLGAAVREVREDDEVRAILLTSESDKFFSIGLDIPELIDLDKGEFAKFLASFEQVCIDLYSLPKPTVAAITGHATAGGAILALCADHRIISSGRKAMGLNEVKLGVTVPWSIDRMLRDLLGSRTASKVMEQGEFYMPEELLALGLVDEVVPPEELQKTAIELATSLASASPEAFAAIKANRTGPVLEEIGAHLEERQREFVELWYGEEAQNNLAEAMLKF
jgi:enoyl-CoA hydratase/carnithine racemase